MTRQQIFPAILILLDIGAAIGYLCVSDWRKVGYWLAAACLTFFISV